MSLFCLTNKPSPELSILSVSQMSLALEKIIHPRIPQDQKIAGKIDRLTRSKKGQSYSTTVLFQKYKKALGLLLKALLQQSSFRHQKDGHRRSDVSQIFIFC